jgi:hypothetical protein
VLRALEMLDVHVDVHASPDGAAPDEEPAKADGS